MNLAPAYVYAATVLSVHDGDTFDADVDLGMFVHVRTAIRLLGCNAFELAHPAGPAARQTLVDLLGSSVVISTTKPDKYGGRTDAAVTAAGVDVVAAMIASGYAVAWGGIGPKPVPPYPVEKP